MSTKLKPGDTAPDFELFDQNLNKFKLSDHLNKKKLVLFFYPKDDTRICTEEACLFRDKYEVFLEKGIEVVGISSDSIESHRHFSNKYRLPFPILSDREGKVKKLYGVYKILGLFSARKTFIINKKGRIEKIFTDLFSAQAHLEEALEALNGSK